MGKGNFIFEMAKTFPNINFIGMEKSDSVISKAIKNHKPLSNLFLICEDAQNIDTFFKKEISLVYLNFSDPWPKKRNTKKRLTHDSFLDQYRLLLKDDGQIIMKTDNQKLFEYSLLNMQDTWQLIEVWLDFRQSEQPDAMTEYEKRFMDEGKPIYRAVWQKR